MSIYGLYSGDDGKSHLVELQVVGSGPSLSELLPSQGWRVVESEPGHSQSRHPTPVIGMTIMLGGSMEIGVGGGNLRHISLVPGDMLIFLDTKGEGHSTALTGPDHLRMVGVSFAATDWPVISQHFSGFPADLSVS